MQVPIKSGKLDQNRQYRSSKAHSSTQMQPVLANRSNRRREKYPTRIRWLRLCRGERALSPRASPGAFRQPRMSLSIKVLDEHSWAKSQERILRLARILPHQKNWTSDPKLTAKFMSTKLDLSSINIELVTNSLTRVSAGARGRVLALMAGSAKLVRSYFKTNKSSMSIKNSSVLKFLALPLEASPQMKFRLSRALWMIRCLARALRHNEGCTTTSTLTTWSTTLACLCTLKRTPLSTVMIPPIREYNSFLAHTCITRPFLVHFSIEVALSVSFFFWLFGCLKNESVLNVIWLFLNQMISPWLSSRPSCRPAKSSMTVSGTKLVRYRKNWGVYRRRQRREVQEIGVSCLRTPNSDRWWSQGRWVGLRRHWNPILKTRNRRWLSKSSCSSSPTQTNRNHKPGAAKRTPSNDLEQPPTYKMKLTNQNRLSKKRGQVVPVKRLLPVYRRSKMISRCCQMLKFKVSLPSARRPLKTTCPCFHPSLSSTRASLLSTKAKQSQCLV